MIFTPAFVIRPQLIVNKAMNKNVIKLIRDFIGFPFWLVYRSTIIFLYHTVDKSRLPLSLGECYPIHMDSYPSNLLENELKKFAFSGRIISTIIANAHVC
jgi:hypothetical protein